MSAGPSPAVAAILAGFLLGGGIVVRATQSQGGDAGLERLVLMRHHYREVSRVHDAVVRGDLRDVRAPALELADVRMPPQVAAATAPFVVSIRQLGRRAAEASTVEEAARVAALMLNQCGSCHLAAGVRPVAETRPAPIVGGIVGHMEDHQLALDHLLQGLLIPSATEWTTGAKLLQQAPLRRDDLPSDPALSRRIRQSESEVHGMALQAINAGTREERSTIYAGLVTRCASCHGLHRGIWGPS